MKNVKIKWLEQPQRHDYPAARSYLSLTMDDEAAAALSRR